jgi:hypothetical protein
VSRSTPRTPGRGWAYLGAVLGGGVSVAANVAHSYVPPTDVDPATWQPQGGAVAGAVFWPVFLFVAVEILTRIQWPALRRWVVVRFLGLLPVAVVAAVVSYRHLSGLLAWYREDALTITIGPLAVDGLMVMATAALLATAAPKRPVPIAPPVELPAWYSSTPPADPPIPPVGPVVDPPVPPVERESAGRAKPRKPAAARSRKATSPAVLMRDRYDQLVADGRPVTAAALLAAVAEVDPAKAKTLGGYPSRMLAKWEAARGGPELVAAAEQIADQAAVRQ